MDKPLAVRVSGLTKRYAPDVQALGGVDLEIPEGTTYALLGPNGAGKTTTVRILAGMTLASGGDVAVLGLNPAKDGTELRRRIGITFQETQLDEVLTGRQILDFHGRLYRIPRAARRKKVDELLGLMELTDAAGRKVKTYSGGMKRRLEIARSIMTEPEFLFIDEPTLGVDPQNRSRIWEYIQKAKDEKGMTILLTTHYMDEAEQIADTVGIIDGGQIVTEGTPSGLIASLGDERIIVRTPDTANQTWSSIESLDEVRQVTKGDDTVSLTVANASGSIAPVARYLDQNGVAVESIDIKRPSLGEVFLSVTGHELRD